MLSKKSNTFLSDYCIDLEKYNYLDIKMYCPPSNRAEFSTLFTQRGEKGLSQKIWELE